MSKKLLFNTLESLVSEKSFKREGNYYRRDIGFVKQALYLNPSRNGGKYFIEMLITYIDLNSERKNTQGDAHLKARLSSYYHPLGNHQSQLEWTCRYEGLNADSPLITIHLKESNYAKNKKCVYCGKETIRSKSPHRDRYNADHNTSVKDGGTGDPSNIQTTCQTCNLDKGGHSDPAYRAKIGR